MGNVLDNVLEVFSSVGEWIADAVLSLQPMFWTADNGLTFLGVLSIAGLSISIILLLLNIIQNFLHFRG